MKKDCLNKFFGAMSGIFYSRSFHCFVMALMVISIASISAYAQGGGLNGGSDTFIEDTLKNIFNKIYDNYRLPFAGIGLAYAGYVALTDEIKGPGRAAKIIVVVMGICLIPSGLRLIENLTKTTFTQ